MSMHSLRERLSYILKNETDGFISTVIEPDDTGLSVYVVFNCYGYCSTDGRRFSVPKKHRTMIVEIAKDTGGNDRRCRRFNWNETIPIEVSVSPKVLLRGRKLKQAHSTFCTKEWNDIFCFIVRNRNAIESHWLGKYDSLELLNAVKQEVQR